MCQAAQYTSTPGMLYSAGAQCCDGLAWPGLGCAVLRCAALHCAVLCWAGLGWAGLGWAGLAIARHQNLKQLMWLRPPAGS